MGLKNGVDNGVELTIRMTEKEAYILREVLLNFNVDTAEQEIVITKIINKISE